MRYVIIGQKNSNDLLVVDTQTMTVSSVDAASTALKNTDDLRAEAYLELHPKSAVKWDDEAAKTGDDQAQGFKTLFEGVRKGDFAQTLARLVGAGKPVVIPPYIARALAALVS